jgi:transposase
MRCPNPHLHHVVSDVTDTTGLRILRVILPGERNPKTRAAMRDIRCKASAETIEAALIGNYLPEHLLALRQSLDLYDFYQTQVSDLDTSDSICKNHKVSVKWRQLQVKSMACVLH